jgi:hypothetical protein
VPLERWGGAVVADDPANEAVGNPDHFLAFRHFSQYLPWVSLKETGFWEMDRIGRK